MPIYQTSKQITKFTLVGISAVCVDLISYYILSQFLDVNISKALGFATGTFVTYNLNKYWTWRQTDRNNKRLALFLVLYAVSLLINVGVNHLGIQYLPYSELVISTRDLAEQTNQLFAMKTAKFVAFFIATAVSSIFNFLGQKYWVFKDQEEEVEELATDTDDSVSPH